MKIPLWALILVWAILMAVVITITMEICIPLLVGEYIAHTEWCAGHSCHP